MIWAILAILGIPLWLIAIFLLVILRERAKVKKIPGSFSCKVRVASGDTPGMKKGFACYKSVGHWVHDVLVLHGGNPFLVRTVPYGINGLDKGPIEVDEGTVKHIEAPTSLYFQVDAGATIEIMCANEDVKDVLGPFGLTAEAVV